MIIDSNLGGALFTIQYANETKQQRLSCFIVYLTYVIIS